MKSPPLCLHIYFPLFAPAAASFSLKSNYSRCFSQHLEQPSVFQRPVSPTSPAGVEDEARNEPRPSTTNEPVISKYLHRHVAQHARRRNSKKTVTV